MITITPTFFVNIVSVSGCDKLFTELREVFKKKEVDGKRVDNFLHMNRGFKKSRSSHRIRQMLFLGVLA